MRGKTHRFIGLVTVGASALLAPTLKIHDTTIIPVLGLLAADCGSLLPDIDLHSSSYGSKHKVIAKHLKHRGPTHSGVLCLCLLFALIYLCSIKPNKNMASIEAIALAVVLSGSAIVSIGFTLLKSLFKKSRSWMLLILLVPVVVILADYIVAEFNYKILHNIFCSVCYGFVVAYISHVVADLFNKKGVPLLMPLNNKHYHIACVKTGTSQEYVFAVIYILFSCVLIFFIKYGGGL